LTCEPFQGYTGALASDLSARLVVEVEGFEPSQGVA